MDEIDSHNPTNLEKKKINDSEKMLKKICRTRSSPNKRH